MVSVVHWDLDCILHRQEESTVNRSKKLSDGGMHTIRVLYQRAHTLSPSWSDYSWQKCVLTSWHCNGFLYARRCLFLLEMFFEPRVNLVYLCSLRWAYNEARGTVAKRLLCFPVWGWQCKVYQCASHCTQCLFRVNIFNIQTKYGLASISFQL